MSKECYGITGTILMVKVAECLHQGHRGIPVGSIFGHHEHQADPACTNSNNAIIIN